MSDQLIPRFSKHHHHEAAGMSRSPTTTFVTEGRGQDAEAAFHWFFRVPGSGLGARGQL